MTEAVNARFLQHLYYRRLSSVRNLRAGGSVAPPNGFEKVTLSTQVLKTRVKFLRNLKL
jgi:hypothetical protein